MIGHTPKPGEHCMGRISGCDRGIETFDCWCECADCLEARIRGKVPQSKLTPRERHDAERRQYYQRTPHTFFAARPAGESFSDNYLRPCLQCGLIETARYISDPAGTIKLGVDLHNTPELICGDCGAPCRYTENHDGVVHVHKADDTHPPAIVTVALHKPITCMKDLDAPGMY